MSEELSFNITGGGPYGMTIKGGLEFGCPVIIDKCKDNSKAFNVGIREGDVILSINGTDVTRATHETAKNCIVQAKSTMDIKIRRGEVVKKDQPSQKPTQQYSTIPTQSTSVSQKLTEPTPTSSSTSTTQPKSWKDNPPPKAHVIVAGQTKPDDYLTNTEKQKVNALELSVPKTAFVGVCIACGQNIVSAKYLKLGTRLWHTEHFNCNSCQKNIASMGFFEDKDKIYCKECYAELFSAKCAKCGKACIDSYLTTNDRSYHSACFLCFKCKCPLTGKPLNFHENQPHCMDCYSEIMSIMCDQCRKPIKPNEGYLEVRSKQYHESCFRCSVCNEELASKGKYVIRDGKPMCPTHN